MNHHIAVVNALTASLYFILSIIDIYYAPKELLYLILTIHFFIMPSVLLSTSVLAYLKILPSSMQILHFAGPIVAALTHTIIGTYFGAHFIYEAEIYLIIFWVFTVSSFSLKHSVINASVVVLINVLGFYYFKELTTQELIIHCFWLFSAYSLSFISAFLLNMLKKELFLKQLQIKDSNIYLQEEINIATKNLQEKNQEIQESLTQFQGLLDLTMETVILFNKEEKIEDINLSGIKLLGYTTKEGLIGKDIKKLIPSEFLEVFTTVLNALDAKTHEMQLRSRQKKQIEVICRASKILINSKEVTMFSAIDVSEVKLKEKLLIKHTREAQMGEMISMIAHQWRQPLATISIVALNIRTKLDLNYFNVETSPENKIKDEFILESLAKINLYIKNLSSTVDDFRNFHKPNKKLKNTSLERTVEKSLFIIGSSLKSSNIEIIEKKGNNDSLNIHQNELMQVILSILKNAQDNFLEKNIENPKITIEYIKEDYTITLKIKDNGGGIEDGILERIFDPYFSTKNEKNGTGLGLYMSKMIVEKHHKGVLLARNEDDGIAFNIQLNTNL